MIFIRFRIMSLIIFAFVNKICSILLYYIGIVEYKMKLVNFLATLNCCRSHPPEQRGISPKHCSLNIPTYP